ncbi:hypothetical protein [Streptomyces sp. SPB074]|uniref:hypothetical protein n=1 Tax=Streptomyces sp. (strain SPB074) TaxID=465543 RepID=UPI00017FE988|nr:hypothetical protein [Streptomyces sp. SPB074]EDY43927.1 serine/arginine repetitive matrix protein 2 [Streptomyces sp. SPB074]
MQHLKGGSDLMWVRLDDRFPSHRKVALLTDGAFRLHVSALCWSAEHLTDGRIGDRELPLVARVRSLKATARRLEAAGLWLRQEDGWLIHDYLDFNPSREEIIEQRRKNAARQEAYRRRHQTAPPEPAEPHEPGERPEPPEPGDIAPRDGGTDAVSNGVTGEPSEAGECTTATRRRHDGDTSAQRNCTKETQNAQVSELRDGVTDSAPSPTPTPTYVADVVELSTGREHPEPLPLTPIEIDGFRLTDAMRRWATQTYPDVPLDHETQKFVWHWQGRGTRHPNWYTAWQKWIANANQYLHRAPARTCEHGPHLPSGDARQMEHQALIAQMRALEQEAGR